MKTKPIFWMLAVLIICSIHSVSQGADKFYYGTYGGRPVEDFPSMKDSLKFNIVVGYVNEDTIDYYVENSLRSIVSNRWDQNSPCKWAAISHYTLWEAEGYTGSYYGFTYTGGNKVWDSHASGDTAMLFSASEDDSGLVQTGPGYNQERKKPLEQDIEYTAEFALKSPDYSPPDDTVCILMVVGKGGVLADSVIFSSQFTDSLTYKAFLIKYYATEDSIQFQIYWMGSRTLYIDYVKAYDDNGWQLVDQGLHDQGIMDYVSQEWVHTIIPETGDTVVYRWYLRDEPGYIDLFEPAHYIDGLLRVMSTERVGFTAFWKNYDDTLVHEYFLRQSPEEYHVDLYPTGWWGPDSSGEEFREGVGQLTHWLNVSKNVADSLDKDFWVSIQTHFYGKEIDNCESCGSYCMEFESRYYCGATGRLPTPNEVRLQTSLALCYGADAILNFCYYSRNDSGFVPEGWDLMLGLWDTLTADGPTPSWYEIKNFTGPRMETLGSVFNQLTWEGAGFHEDVATVTGSFIDSLKPAPGETLLTTYAEVGFFTDDADTDYFMLVNRKCLPSEEQNITVYIDSAAMDSSKKMWYVIDQYSQHTTFTGAINGAIPFTTHLDPGEGKLFKLVPFLDEAFHGTANPLTWQGGIMVDGDVTVDSGKTLVILPPAEITSYANTDILGTWDPQDCDFVINGGLRAEGTEADSIVFTSTETNPNDWEGITVTTTATGGLTLLSHCVVEGAHIGIQLLDSLYSNADTITHSTFSNNETGVRVENEAARVIDNTISLDATLEWSFGLYVKHVDTDSLAIAENNTITGQWKGVYVGFSSTKLTGNVITTSWPNAEGIRCYDCPSLVIDEAKVSGDSIEYGFWIRECAAEIIGSSAKGTAGSPAEVGAFFEADLGSSMRTCVIENFSEKGVWCLQCKPDLGTTIDKGYNKIYSDSGYYVYHNPGSTPIGSPPDSVYAQYNWWGEYPPDSSRFFGNVIFMPADSVEWEEPDSLQLKVVLSEQVPREFELVQNYPNPFNPVTSIQFAVGSHQSPAHTTLKIYNVLGQLVRTLVEEEKAEGSYTVYWDGRNQNGKQVSSGIYFYKLEAGDFTDVKKMVLLR